MERENKELFEKAKELKRAYHREYLRKYRALHPEKVKQWNLNYWIRRVQKLQEQRGSND